MPLIACQNAAFMLDGNIIADGLDFKVDAGDYLCVVGENGSGKSTLLRGMLRLIPAAAGRVVMGDGLKQRDIGYLPQQTVRDFPASVYEVVLSGRLNRCGSRPFFSKKDKLSAERAMSQLAIHDLRGKSYRELSGGQQRRALLARALCAADKLLLLDEPAAGLDPAASLDLYKLINSINREAGMAVVMVSHDIKKAIADASHILHLKNKQVFFGTAAEYSLSDPGRNYIGSGTDDC